MSTDMLRAPQTRSLQSNGRPPSPVGWIHLDCTGFGGGAIRLEVVLRGHMGRRRVRGEGSSAAGPRHFGSRLKDSLASHQESCWRHTPASLPNHYRQLAFSPSHIGYHRRLSDHLACITISSVLCDKIVPLSCCRRHSRATRTLSCLQLRRSRVNHRRHCRMQRLSFSNGTACP